ncbi:hypothetical protein HDU87_004954 [Geranomyces variabilis]|uniref:Anthranilate synthase component 2 n=1 Tax=Geranomyces variabilis TaxID=109894 RepID=A0AAD5TJU0_9FUNG|nr:hypothetical protein HDU87_004954 [Geranomyces variabilis]
MPSLPSLPSGLRTLIVDNYDSYTFNLYQYCSAAGGHTPVVIRNNQFTWEDVRERILPHFDCVIISPGPGRPERPADFGVCGDILRHAELPILGVCLGHQGLASVYGGKVVHAREPVHGRVSPVVHLAAVPVPDRPIGLFDGLPNPFQAVRYHSLVVSPTDVPAELRITAWTEDEGGDRIIQGLEHREKPIWGVQFHPESICTEGGQRLLGNFYTLATEYLRSSGRLKSATSIPADVAAMSVVPEALVAPISHNQTPSGEQRAVVHVRKLGKDHWTDAQAVFTDVFSKDEASFWLDSAKVEPNLSRFSFMGSMSTQRSFSVSYCSKKRTITRTRLSQNLPPTRPFHTVTESFSLEQHDTFFMWMSRTIKEHGLQGTRIHLEGSSTADVVDAPLPFNFTCGMVGFFGYEMKEESLGSDTSHKTKCDGEQHFHIVDGGATPDASFLLADRVVAFDHVEMEIYLLALRLDGGEKPLVDAWIREITQQIEAVGVVRQRQIGTQRVLTPWSLNSATPHITDPERRQRKQPKSPPPKSPPLPSSAPPRSTLKLAVSQTQYLADVRSSLAKIRDGETYEVCLTTQISASLRSPKDANAPDSYELYKDLRRRNPAPYGAFLRFGAAFALASSSPERFMRLEKDGLMSMKPIKGTVRRAQKEAGMSDQDVQVEDERRRVALENDEKNRAENLMIVDLIRNDLNTISEPRSVNVPALMVVESYATVHQLVTTVEAQLRTGLNAVDAVMHSFPPGSMTGAPKLRTVEILETLEKAPRGPYSGVLGYFSLNGAAEFSVIIRTAVCTANGVSVGAGGAIVSLSDPQEEFEEMLLKANSVIPSIMEVYGIGAIDVSGR